MWRVAYILSLVLFTVFLELNADCGCNKIKRSEIEIVKRDDDASVRGGNTNENDLPNEICSKPPESQLLSLINDDDVLIAEGEYILGTNEPIFVEDRESPERTVKIDKFFIDKYEVSNRNFDEFVKATGHLTLAEKFGDSFVFKGLMSDAVQKQYIDYRVASAPWWFKLNNTNWKQPEGDGSSIADRMDHPVVHVSWFDAVAYCKWRNKRLPTEDEWEVACRGNKKRKLFPWGNKLNAKDQHWTNIWQGKFPDTNTEEDGYTSTCPVDKFRQNDYDLHNMVGNVWEWTDSLWDEQSDAKKTGDQLETVERVKKGGSYLCHKSYCYRYRCAARSSNTADSSAGNLGFRCARS